MNDDELFVSRLRARADAVAPAFDIDPAPLVRRARTRRAVTRAVGIAATVTLVAGAGAWAADAVPWGLGGAGASVVPGTPDATSAPHGDPTPSATPTADARPTYWYTLTETVSADGTSRQETWFSRDLPGLMVYDGDLAAPGARGPVNSFGRYYLDGAWVDMLRDPGELPTDPDALAAVLRASLEPDRGSGTDDQKVLGMVHDLLLDGGLVPLDLRLALWDVAAGLPGAEASTGESTAGGRTWTTLTGPLLGGGVWTADPATGLLLSMSEASGSVTHYLEQREVHEVPVEPTLEMSGCVAWETC